MNVTLGGTMTELRELHPIKAHVSLTFTLDEIMMLFKERQLLNMYAFIFVISDESWIFANKLQPLKARFPMFTTLDGIAMLVRELQLSKALSPIDFTDLGISILFRDQHP